MTGKLQEISGINEVSQGTQPHPNQSGEAINKLQQQAVGRMRLKSREQADSLQRLGKLLASDILQFWTTEKTLFLENKGGKHETIVFNPLSFKDLQYEIGIDEGTMAGIDRDAYNAYLSRMKQAGDITFSQYLQVADLPNKEKLLSFAQENDQTQQQAQELQGQLEELQGQLAQIEQEKMMLLKKVDPSFLNNEQLRMSEDLERQEDIQQLVNNVGANQGQPI